MNFTALVVMIQDKDEEAAIEAAKDHGTGSVTILHGKTIGLEEKKVFFGLTLEEKCFRLALCFTKKGYLCM